MISLFSLISYAKITEIVLSVEPDHSSPLAFAEGLFIFFINYFSEKEGFLYQK